MTRRILVTALLALAACTPAPSAQAREPGDLSNRVYAQRVFKWVNHEREAHGLEPLEHHSCTQQTSLEWARHMRAVNEFFHSTDGAVAVECDGHYSGEVLARGPFWPRKIVRMWMASPDHRRAILSPFPTHLSISTVRNSNGGRFIVGHTLLP